MHDPAPRSAEQDGCVTAPVRAGEPAFDRSSLLERSMGNVQVMRAVLGMFLAESTEALRALHSALHRGNLDVAFEVAYTLKGAAANAGASGIMHAAEATAQAADEFSADGTLLSLGVLEAEILAFRSAVASEIGPGPAGNPR